jgi:hypothetical protein
MRFGDENILNGCEIHCDEEEYRMSQENKLRNIAEATKDQEIDSVRAAMEYIATSTRLALAAP